MSSETSNNKTDQNPPTNQPAQTPTVPTAAANASLSQPTEFPRSYRPLPSFHTMQPGRAKAYTRSNMPDIVESSGGARPTRSSCELLPAPKRKAI